MRILTICCLYLLLGSLALPLAGKPLEARRLQRSGDGKQVSLYEFFNSLTGQVGGFASVASPTTKKVSRSYKQGERVGDVVRRFCRKNPQYHHDFRENIVNIYPESARRVSSQPFLQSGDLLLGFSGGTDIVSMTEGRGVIELQYVPVSFYFLEPLFGESLIGIGLSVLNHKDTFYMGQLIWHFNLFDMYAKFHFGVRATFQAARMQNETWEYYSQERVMLLFGGHFRPLAIAPGLLGGLRISYDMRDKWLGFEISGHIKFSLR